MTPATTTPQLGRGQLALVYLLMATTAIVMDVSLPAVPAIAAALQSDYRITQITITVYIVGFASGQIFWGHLADRFGRKPVLLAGLSLFVLLGFGVALSPDVYTLITLRLLQGLCGGVAPVVGRAIVRDIAEGPRAARLMSTAQMIIGIAPAIGPVIGTLLLTTMSWRGLFTAFALFGIALALLTRMHLPETRPAHTEHTPLRHFFGRTAPQLFVDPWFRTGTLLTFFMFAVYLAFFTNAPAILVGTYGVDERVFGPLFSLVVIARVVGPWINRRLVGDVGLERMIGAGLTIAALGAVAIAPVALGWDSGATWLLAAIGLCIVGTSIVESNTLVLALTHFGHRAGAAGAVFGSLQIAGGASFGIICSLLYDGTARVLAAAIVLCVAASTVIFYRFLQHHAQRSGIE